MSEKREQTKCQALLTNDLTVVNVGLEGFVKDLQDCGIAVVHVDWSPPLAEIRKWPRCSRNSACEGRS